jgi:myo-inositol-1(or 4)-monophosphatase
VDDGALLHVLNEAAVAIRAALDGLTGWGLSGARPGQYRTDVVADAAAIAVLTDAGLGVLSEETGAHHADRPLFAVLDPVDGSTNASRALPWYATSICVLDDQGPRVALVVNQATGERFDAVRGGGARCDGVAIVPSGKTSLAESLIGLSGYPRRHLGWRQYRALGAAALDLCAVASGRLDAYLDCTGDAHGPWDYLGGLLVCTEAGAVVADLAGRDLVTRGHADRRTPVAAATPELLDELVRRARRRDRK